MKYLGHPFLTAVLAGFMQLLAMNCEYMKGEVKVAFFVSWAGFAAWACYFLAGCTPKGGLKVIGCWAGGVIGSVIIIEMGTKFCGFMNPMVAFPLAVFLIAFAVICFEKVPALDMIPAWFVGAACYFAYHGTIAGALGKAGASSMQIHMTAALAIMVSCVVAQVFGFVTVTIRGKYQAMVDGPAEETADAKEAQAA